NSCSVIGFRYKSSQDVAQQAKTSGRKSIAHVPLGGGNSEILKQAIDIHRR
ncbi:hypothetical protein K7432_016042, partial [Basidiobolus ranarum]